MNIPLEEAISHMKFSRLTGLILAIAVIGCSVEVEINENDETDMGSHHVVIKPGSTFTSSSSSFKVDSKGDSKTYRYSCGDVTLEINNEELIVNNSRYGKLSPGVDILVDHGIVSVGGEKREGTAVTAEE
ncbi:hypothetical protein OAF34_03060 [Pirellulaceae bacterium]|nr:hypothetical protein [Pirellulaceae bacterium]